MLVRTSRSASASGKVRRSSTGPPQEHLASLVKTRPPPERLARDLLVDEACLGRQHPRRKIRAIGEKTEQTCHALDPS
jgi:hypothetical protein